MWESSRVRAWMAMFIVAVLSPGARAEPVPAPPIAPSSEPPPSIPESAPSTLPVEQQPGQAPRRPLYFVARGGVDFGGDDVFKYVNADSPGMIQAGQRYSVSGGVLIKPDPWMALEATLGYKWESSDGPNGTIGISRIPLEVIASVTAGGLRFGAGVAVHFNPSFYSNDANGRHLLDLTLDHAIGGMLQLAYHIGDEEGVDLGVRATYIQYEDKSYTYATYDGTCLGFFLGFWL
jgi:hypothetical protein